MPYQSARWSRQLALLGLGATLVIAGAGSYASAVTPLVSPASAAPAGPSSESKTPPFSGTRDVRPGDAGTAGAGAGASPRKPTRGVRPRGDLGENLRLSQDNSVFPKNETTVAINPANAGNVAAGANDYRIGVAQSGFYSSPGDNGEPAFATEDGSNPDGLLPMVADGRGGAWDGGGDPAVDFGGDGRAYYASIFFNRTNPPAVRGLSCINGVAVSTSDNGGLTWTRASVVTGAGIVAYHADNDDCSIFHDKEYIAVDRYSSGTRNGRVYVTWTRFDRGSRNSPIYFSQSADRGVNWSPGAAISGDNADDCVSPVPGPCDLNQFSVPAVGSDGTVYVVFKNFNTPEENQILMVKCAPERDCTSAAGWSAPVKVATVFDQNYAPGFRLSNSAFRLGQDTWNIAVDRSASPERLYVFWSDNRHGGSNPTGNGATGGTGTDVFVAISTDGGDSWSDAIQASQDGSRNDHFMGWGAVAPAAGAAPGQSPVCVMYLDRRSDPDNKLNEVWASCSVDGGDTWSDQPLTDSGPQNCVDLAGFPGADGRSTFIGDYNGLAAGLDSAGKALFFAAWVDCRGASPSLKKSDIWGVAFHPRGR
jgi:hypothetical protein